MRVGGRETHQYFMFLKCYSEDRTKLIWNNFDWLLPQLETVTSISSPETGLKKSGSNTFLCVSQGVSPNMLPNNPDQLFRHFSLTFLAFT